MSELYPVLDPHTRLTAYIFTRCPECGEQVTVYTAADGWIEHECAETCSLGYEIVEEPTHE